MDEKLKLLFTPQAIIDLESIYVFTLKKWGIVQADHYQDMLFVSMQSILKNPEIGINYLFKKGKFRKLISNRHLIFYKIDGINCIIVRILHEKMDLDSYLL